MHSRTLLRTLAGAVGVFLCCACGDEGEPLPGYPDPCDTAAAALLGCPPSTGTWGHGPRNAQTACQRLVSCGVLAAERKVNEGRDHYLDYAWCAERLQSPGAHSDPCGGRRYTDGEVEAVIDCIHSTPCVSLGAALSDKGSSAEPDSYQCANGETRRTATVCDQGLLSY